jgi:hypothetical protein
MNCPDEALPGLGDPASVEPAPPAQAHSRTSIEAAEAITPLRGTLQKVVYRTIAENGPCSDEEGIDLSGLNPSTWRPRRVEVARGGWIDQVGYTVTKAGRRAVLWGIARNEPVL